MVLSPQSKIDRVGQNYAVTGKAAFETNRRFWEEDEDIYGGITNCSFNTPAGGSSFIPQLSTIWYPSSGFGSDRGVMVGYYNFGTNAANFGLLRDSDRVRIAQAQTAKIHPQLNQTFVSGLSIYWPAVKYNLGGWSSSGINSYPSEVVSALSTRDGNIWLAGEHMSNLTGWMAGGNVVYLTAFLTPDPYLRTRFVYDSRGNRILQAVPRSEIDEAFANGLRPDDEDFPGEPTYDYQGWFRAYARFFDKDNPNRAGTFSSATAITRSPRLAVAPAPEPGATAVKTARSTVGLPGLVVPGWLIEIEAIAAYPER